MENTKWKKAYKGPFVKHEAEKLAGELKGTKVYPDENMLVIESNIRRRRPRKGKCVCTAACGAGLGHNKMYDVYIKIKTNI